MTVVTFASGSTGNCALLRCGGTNVLIDAGISLRRLRAALAQYDLSPERLDGVLITHEHGDHTTGLTMLIKYCAVPIFAPGAVLHHLLWSIPGIEPWLRRVTVGETFPLGALAVTAFPTSHDTEESVGYLAQGDVRFGFCTDTGCITQGMLSALAGCDAAIVEANHDVNMLRCGPYPAALKRRVLSDRGHLSNDDCGRLSCYLAQRGARALVLGHLSRQNNLPSLARDTVRAALDAAGFTGVRLLVAPAAEKLELEVVPCWA